MVITLHLIYVSRKRTIVSGVGTLSRGDTTKGIMQGNSMLTFFPFHLRADHRSKTLVPWIKSWWTGKSLQLIYQRTGGSIMWL